MADELPDFEGGAGRIQEAIPVVIAPTDYKYEAVAASDTDEVLGATGAVDDFLSHIVVQPATIAPGNVIVKDGTTAIYTYPGTADYPASLQPFVVPFGIRSRNAGGFKVTTGANVSVLAAGDFT